MNTFREFPKLPVIIFTNHNQFQIQIQNKIECRIQK